MVREVDSQGKPLGSGKLFFFLMQQQENKKKMDDAFMEIQQQFLIFTFFKNYYIIEGNFNCR